jgi:acyl-CoA synthetase (AMP-forming)/AMP-acid ligase II
MIFRSPYPDVTISDLAITPFVLGKARELGRKPALIDGASGRSLGYAELVTSVRAVAGQLAARGFRKGDAFAIFSTNALEYAIIFHAVTSLGGFATTLNPLATEEEVARQLRDAGCRSLLTTPALVDKVHAATRSAPLREVFVLGEAPGATPFVALLAPGADPPEVAIDPSTDLAALPYSSGTTGMPKGVMLTHRNLVANLTQGAATRIVTSDDVVLCVLPMFHIYGLVVIMNAALYAGATIIVLPRFDLEQMLQAIQTHRITVAPLVPPIVLALAKQPIVDRFDLSSLKMIFCAAAPLSAELSRACIERVPCTIRQGYGMTEASPATHISPVEPEKIVLGSVGVCLPNTECKLVDTETGAELAQGQAGEICVRGPQVMKGYLGQPEVTARTVDPEGWLHTGDIGSVDAAGQLFILDRVKELIKYKGFQVAPAELEALLVSHPCVADAAVVPAPDTEAGEVPKAFVVLKCPASADDLMKFVADRVTHYKRIREVAFIDRIPRSPSGKVLRRMLKGRPGSL